MYKSISVTLLYLHRSSKLKTQNRSYLEPQGVSEVLSTLILKEMLRCVFLEESGSAKVMSSDENITGPEGTYYWIFEKHQILENGGYPPFDLEPQTISEALVAAKRTNEMQRTHW